MDKVNSCTNGPRGVELQLEAEKFSQDVIARSGFVPTIVYKNNYRAGVLWDSLDDFEKVVKEQLETL